MLNWSCGVPSQRPRTFPWHTEDSTIQRRRARWHCGRHNKAVVHSLAGSKHNRGAQARVAIVDCGVIRRHSRKYTYMYACRQASRLTSNKALFWLRGKSTTRVSTTAAGSRASNHLLIGTLVFANESELTEGSVHVPQSTLSPAGLYVIMIMIAKQIRDLCVSHYLLYTRIRCLGSANTSFCSFCIHLSICSSKQRIDNAKVAPKAMRKYTAAPG